MEPETAREEDAFPRKGGGDEDFPDSMAFPVSGPVSALWEEDDRFGRATLEEEADGSLLLTVSGPSREDPDIAFSLDPEESALYRTWGAEYAGKLVRQVRAEPGAYASRNLLPPFAPGEGSEGEAPEGEAPLAASTRRFGVGTLLAVALLGALALAWAFDRPAIVGPERHGLAVYLSAAPVEEAERASLVVTLYGGEQVSVSVSADHVLRPGARVVLREYRSPLFGKRAYRFIRYV